MKKPSNMKCGDCLYFKSAHKPGEKLCCSKLGMKAFTQASPCFYPDINAISNDIESFAVLAQTYTAFNAKQRRILVHLLLKGGQKKDIPFGTKVYLACDSQGQGKYLSDYVSGYVLGYQGDHVIICGSVGRKTVGRSFVAYIYPDSCYTLSQFQKMKEQMVADGLINNPRTIKGRRVTSIESYDPPSIDNAPETFKAKVKKTKPTDIYERIVGGKLTY